MIRRNLGSFAAVALLLCCAASSTAESISSSRHAVRAEIKVLVTLDNHRSVGEQLRVDLLNHSSVPTGLTFTDTSGRAWMQVSEAGAYRVRVSGQSIQPTTSPEFTVDDSHRTPVAELQVKPRTVLIFNPQPKTGALTSATELAVPQDAREYFHDGLQLLQHGKYDKALQNFLKAVHAYPRYDSAYNNLGAVYIKMNDATRAWLAFEKAVQINDKNADADRNFARLLIQTQKFERAQLLLRKSLVVDPLSASGLVLLATADIALKEYDDALADAKRVHELPHEGLSVAHYIAGQSLEHNGKPADAASEYELYLQESPFGPEAPEVKQALARVTAPVTASMN